MLLLGRNVILHGVKRDGHARVYDSSLRGRDSRLP
jgi:hypothetical protein